MKKTIVFLMCLFGLCLGCFSQTPTAVTNYVMVTNVVYVQPQQSQPQPLKVVTNYVVYVQPQQPQQLNPESYTYYQYYYLQPRTLGYSYQLMYPAVPYYRPPTFSFGFGYGMGHSSLYYYGNGHSHHGR